MRKEQSSAEAFSTSQVLQVLHAFLGGSPPKKDRLYYVERHPRLRDSKQKPALRRQARSSQRPGRIYDATRLERLSTIFVALAAGFTFEVIARELTTNPWTLLPSEKLAQLEEVRRELLSAAVFKGEAALAKAMSEGGLAFLECAGLSVWLAEEGMFTKLLVRSGQVPSFDQALSATPAPLRLHGHEIEHHFGRSPAGEPRPNGLLQLVLEDPTRHETRRRIGILRAWGRSSRDGAPTGVAFFNRIDEALGRRFSAAVVESLETCNLLNASRALMTAVVPSGTFLSFGQYLRRLLDQTREFMNADRADALVPDEAMNQLVIVGQSRARRWEGQPQIGLRGIVPGQSVSMSVYRTRETRIVHDVNLAPEYYAVAEGMNSEITVPVLRRSDPGEKPIAVLNFESVASNFFDERDKHTLEHLTSVAALAAEFAELYEAVSGDLAVEGTAALRSAMLDRIHREVGIDEGAIYLVDVRRAVLQCVATRPSRTGAALAFDFDFDRPALVTRVFRDRTAYFTKDPWNDSNVSKEGLNHFGIQGPILAVPLLFGQRAVGVLVLWSRSGSAPRHRDIPRIELYAKLAVTTVGTTNSEKVREQCFTHVRNLLDQLQLPGVSQESFLLEVLRGITRTGFNRARMFRYEKAEPQHFRCIASLGVNPPNTYRDLKIFFEDQEGSDIPGSAYAQWTRKDMEENNLTVKLRKPTAKDDYYAKRLGKPPGMPWAVAPMCVRGEPVGYIAADNAGASEPYDDITDSSREYLALYAAVAALGLAETSL